MHDLDMSSKLTLHGVHGMDVPGMALQNRGVSSLKGLSSEI
jgi:hypothetical protein